MPNDAVAAISGYMGQLSASIDLRMRSQTISASSTVVSGRMIANSSPPYRHATS